MPHSKLSSGLESYLSGNKEAFIDVIIEITPASTNMPVAQTDQNKMDRYKEEFFKASRPIENLIKSHGGNILGITWINKSIKASIAANHLSDLINCENITSIDLPEKIKQEGK